MVTAGNTRCDAINLAMQKPKEPPPKDKKEKGWNQ
jgi:hypothetical protein